MDCQNIVFECKNIGMLPPFLLPSRIHTFPFTHPYFPACQAILPTLGRHSIN